MNIQIYRQTKCYLLDALLKCVAENVFKIGSFSLANFVIIWIIVIMLINLM